jgi:ribonuclease HI
VAANKYYVVWKGRRTGVFSSWAECERQVKGFVGAQYKAFSSLMEATKALHGRYAEYAGRASSIGKWRVARTGPQLPSLCVDAACSGSPGRLEYRGVKTESGHQLFRAGPFAEGTNNVGEFLAIVEGLRWLNHHNHRWPLYSDSENAIGWVHAKKCRTKLVPTRSNCRLFELIAKAEDELHGAIADGGAPSGGARILKWDTREWGEIPADFGRK